MPFPGEVLDVAKRRALPAKTRFDQLGSKRGLQNSKPSFSHDVRIVAKRRTLLAKPRFGQLGSKRSLTVKTSTNLIKQ